MFSLPIVAEQNLLHTGHQEWLTALPAHVENIVEIFHLSSPEVLEGGVTGLAFTALDENGRRIVVKTAPESLAHHAKAMLILKGDPSTPELIYHDQNLNAILMSYIPGDAVEQGQVLTEELVALLHAWKSYPSDEMIDLRCHWLQWVEMTEQRLELLGDHTRSSDLAQDDAWCAESRWIWPPAEEQYRKLLPRCENAIRSANCTGLLHGDLGPHNMLRDPAGKIIAVDFQGIKGDRNYDIGMAGLLQDYQDPATVVSRTEELAEALGGDPEKALLWATFRGLFSTISLCTRADAADDTKALFTSAAALLDYLGKS